MNVAVHRIGLSWIGTLLADRGCEFEARALHQKSDNALQNACERSMTMEIYSVLFAKKRVFSQPTICEAEIKAYDKQEAVEKFRKAFRHMRIQIISIDKSE